MIDISQIIKEASANNANYKMSVDEKLKELSSLALQNPDNPLSYPIKKLYEALAIEIDAQIKRSSEWRRGS